MKTIFKYNLCLICFAAFFLCNAQSQYTFDKMLVYSCESESDSNSKTREHMFFINSENNSYYARIHELDSLKFTLYMRDNNRLTFYGDVNKEDFYKAEFIDLNCKALNRWDNKSYIKSLRRPKVKVYRDYDTIINGNQFRYIEITKNKKRLKNGYNYKFYIIDESVDKPIHVINDPGFYEYFNRLLLIKKGMVRSYGSKYKKSTYCCNLISMHDICKSFIIPEDCNNLEPINISHN